MSIAFYGDDWSYSVDTVGMYSDSVPFVKVANYTEIVDKTKTILLQPGTFAEFFAGLALLRGIYFRRTTRVKLVLPYIPGARQDRVNPTGDVLDTLGFIGDTLNWFQFDEAFSLDPHSLVSNQAIDNLRSWGPNKVLHGFINGQYDGIIAPDKGAESRALAVAVEHNLPVYYGKKHRDVSTGRLSGFSIDIQPGNYLVVDDICDGGGTFIGLAGAFPEGVTADLYVSHGIFSKGTDDLLNYFGQVITTDSRPQGNHKGVTVIPIVDRMVASSLSN